MKAIEKLKEKRFLVEITSGNYYAQHSEVEFFATAAEAEKFYNEASLSQSELEYCSWSKDGDQPTFSIELMELKSVPKKDADELEEDVEDLDESFFADIYHTYSERKKTKSYFFNKEAVIFDYDSEEEKEGKEKMNRWELTEYTGSTYSSLPFSEDVFSIIDGTESKMKGGIE